MIKKFRKVQWHCLQVGDHIRLGSVKMVAVDANGECPIWVMKFADLARNAVEVYGSLRAASAALQWSRKALTASLRRH